MNTTPIFFYLFASVLLFAAFRVITARSAVHAALFLVLSFFSASCIWILLEAEFLAITLILVYVGAVMVLFLFVVMMLDLGNDSFRAGFWTHFPVAAFVGVVIVLEMALVLIPGFDVRAAPIDLRVAEMGNTKLLGIELYTDYVYPLQIAAVVLLVAIVAAIALTLRRRKDSKNMNPADQVNVQRADRVRLIKMKPVVDANDAPASDLAPGDKA